MSLKIDVCSDLHVDTWLHVTQIHDPADRLWSGEPRNSLFYYIDWRKYKNPQSRVLIIAGDTANNMNIAADVIQAASEEYEYVVVVNGNHEHYGEKDTVNFNEKQLTQLIAPFPNVYHLTGEQGLVVDKTVFFGVTGWYDFKAYEDKGISEIIAKKAWSQRSNDSRLPNFGSDTPEKLAAIQAINLANQVYQATTDDDFDHIILTTHMSPRSDIMLWKDHDPIWNGLTPSYVNTHLKMVLDQDINHKIRYWIYGHTHDRKMTHIDGVTYVNNARGYPKENPPFTLTQITVDE